MSDVVISVPVWDFDENQGYFTHRFISECLEKTEGDFTIVAVDNHSTYQPTLDYINSIKDPRFKLITNLKNLGYAKAANQGIKWGMAHGAQIGVISNNDIIINTPSWLNEFVSPLRTNPKQLIGARVIPDNGMTNIDGMGCIPYAEGWLVAFDRSLLDKIGGEPFDRNFHSYFEDCDLSVRATLAGYPIVQSDCFAWGSDEHISVAKFLGGVVSHVGGASGYERADFSPRFNPKHNFATVTQESRNYFAKKWGLVPKVA